MEADGRGKMAVGKAKSRWQKGTDGRRVPGSGCRVPGNDDAGSRAIGRSGGSRKSAVG
jgi:hypothetical protein